MEKEFEMKMYESDLSLLEVSNEFNTLTEEAQLMVEHFGKLKGMPKLWAKKLTSRGRAGRNSEIKDIGKQITSMHGLKTKLRPLLKTTMDKDTAAVYIEINEEPLYMIYADGYSEKSPYGFEGIDGVQITKKKRETQRRHNRAPRVYTFDSKEMSGVDIIDRIEWHLATMNNGDYDSLTAFLKANPIQVVKVTNDNDRIAKQLMRMDNRKAERNSRNMVNMRQRVIDKALDTGTKGERILAEAQAKYADKLAKITEYVNKAEKPENIDTGKIRKMQEDALQELVDAIKSVSKAKRTYRPDVHVSSHSQSYGYDYERYKDIALGK